MLILSRRQLVAGLAVLALTPPAFAGLPMLEVWKNRGCACCSAWAKLFEQAGFAVTMHEVDDVAVLSAAAGTPPDLAGCHTAKVGNYVVEGHVPVAAVQRLLSERPLILGLAVPGMPKGSPGMESDGEPMEPFEIFAFSADGSRHIFK
jgi:hypothetical protein